MADEASLGADLPATSLSHKELRMMCLDNDLPISGNKSTLVERLLDAGVAWDELGLPLDVENPTTLEEREVDTDEEDSTDPESATDFDEVNDEELILEESELEVQIDEEVAEMEENEVLLLDETETELDPTPEGDTIIEAEIVDAEIVGPSFVSKSIRNTEGMSSSLNLANLLQPKMGLAVVVVALLLGAGSWYMLSQPQPFTPDQLRYGDQMRFSISGGNLQIVGDEMVENIATMLGAEDSMCGEIELDFMGEGHVSVTLGDSSQITSQPSNQMIGAVEQIGPYGNSWLTVEKELQYNFDDVDIETNGFVGNHCSSTVVHHIENNQADVDVSSWTELRSQDMLKTRIDYYLHGGDLGSVDGTAVAYDMSSFGDWIQTIIPGIAIAFSPVELNTFLEGALIKEGASGEKWSWNWSVAGIDEVAGKEAWKIYVENEQINDRCFGTAKINLWVVEDSPWPIKQYVELRISNSEDSRDDCEISLLEQIGQTLLDFEMPQGSFNLQMTMLELSSSSGGDLVDWNKDYSNRPQTGDGHLTADYDWAMDGQHMPDLSDGRDHTIENTINCINVTDSSSELISALNAEGYVWRAFDDRTDVTRTSWNLSWVNPAHQSGWAVVEIWNDDFGGHQCRVSDAGVYDGDTIEHNRDAINPTSSLDEIENQLLDSDDFPLLSGSSGLIGMNGRLHNDASFGYMVVTPTEDLTDMLGIIGRDEGAVSVTVHRGWSGAGWDETVDLLMDATDGRLIGWVKVSKSE